MENKSIAVSEFTIKIAKRNLEIWAMYNEGYAPSFIAEQYGLAGIARILTHMRKLFNVVA
jgi:hypothetical protein